MKRVTITMALLILVGCSRREEAEQQNRLTETQKESIEWVRQTLIQAYWEGGRTNRLERISRQLASLSEPDFLNAPTNKLSGHLYRFVWMRTFDKPIVVALRAVGNGQLEVRSKVFAGKSGFSCGPLETEVVSTNNSPEATKLMADLDHWFFWVPEYDGESGADGATWMIDGINNGHYHIIHWYSPKSGWVRQTGLRFLKVARVEVDEKKIY